ncbi:hypothetical protein AB0C18_07830 [Nonomuraea muscovyensis]|uniref:hypothetical protein n=1 Tax=Nonomuraea muscovyensis TaxID=1124761 RepID=UPI0033C892F7
MISFGLGAEDLADTRFALECCTPPGWSPGPAMDGTSCTAEAVSAINSQPHPGQLQDAGEGAEVGKRGWGDRIERVLETFNQMCLAPLPGYAPVGTPDRAGRPGRPDRPELDAAIGRFIREVHNLRPHSETRTPPFSGESCVV